MKDHIVLPGRCLIKMDKKPLVSLVVAAYNREHYLADNLHSCRYQTMKDIDIIVVDDGSSDYTDKLMEYFLAEDKRIRYFKREHKGASATRNFGNEQALADIILTVDSDDILNPDRAKWTYNFFAKNNVDVMCGSYLQIDFFCNPLYQHNLVMSDYEHADRFAHTSSAFKKEVLLKERYNESIKCDIDGDLIRRLHKKGYKFGIQNKIYCKVRYSQEGLTRKFYTNQIIE